MSLSGATLCSISQSPEKTSSGPCRQGLNVGDSRWEDGNEAIILTDTETARRRSSPQRRTWAGHQSPFPQTRPSHQEDPCKQHPLCCGHKDGRLASCASCPGTPETRAGQETTWGPYTAFTGRLSSGASGNPTIRDATCGEGLLAAGWALTSFTWEP